MNTYSKLLLGAAVISLAACSSEEPLGNGEDQPQEVIKPTGDIAYLNVRIQSADGNGGRAADGGYEYGTGNENEVKNAYFYFYDENGQFVLESNSWLGGTDNDKNPTENVEVFGKNTVVLTGLTGKGYPSWVVTVLNRPAGFTPALTLDGMADLYRNTLIEYTEEGKVTTQEGFKNDVGNFIMTTSSYFGDDNKNGEGWNYFATKLEPENFLKEMPVKETVSEATLVNIYVERLAARVGVDMSGISNKRHSQVYTVYDGETKITYPLYELDVTVAGENNPNLGSGSNTAATKVYIAITGWELNSTASSSYYFKNLRGWDDTTDFGRGWAWNNADHHRSFWGQARNYGLVDRNMNVNDLTWEELTQVVETATAKGTKLYCNETTNTVNNILVNNGVSPRRTPTVLLSAVVCDANGDPLTLVEYRGVQYTKAGFISKILQTLDKANFGENYFTRKKIATDINGKDVFEYTQLGPDDVKLVSANAGLGTVNLAVADETVEYWTKLVETTQTDETGKTYKTYKAQNAHFSSVNVYLASATNNSQSDKATAATDGATVYPIPLIHLNEGDGDICEGQYGVVRNHCYTLSITKIKSIGDGVFIPKKTQDEEPEPINPDDPKDPTYYVESSINILSWKVVNQEAEI